MLAMAKDRSTKLDAFHWHEALDRSLLAFEFFSERVAQHVAVRSQPALRREVDEIADRMFRLYQTLGSRTLIEQRQPKVRRIR
jgi:hypothetical protein